MSTTLDPRFQRAAFPRTTLSVVLVMATVMSDGGPAHAQGCDTNSSLTVGQAIAESSTALVELRGHSRCDVNGFGLAIGHDSTRVEFLEAEPGVFLEEHAGTDLYLFSSAASSVDFMTLFVAFDLSLPLTVPPTKIPTDTLLATLVYALKPGAEPGDVDLRNEDETFGNPPIANIYTTEKLEIRPALQSGLIRIPDLRPRFSRGDVDANGSRNLADASVVILYLFSGGEAPLCMKAADADDNGAVNVSDTILLLNHLFLGGVSPAAPFDECGPDPTADDLGCEDFPACR